MEIAMNNPSREELQKSVLDKGQGVLTETGSLSVTTQISNRLAKDTEIFWLPQNGMRKPLWQKDEINLVFEYMRKNPMIEMDRLIGASETYACKLFVSAKYPHLALYWGSTLSPSSIEMPHFITYCIPEWPTRHVYVFPESPDNPYVTPITFVLGTDYTGEVKMSFLRQFMHTIKREHKLGMHAASKIVRVQDRSGNLEDRGVLILGLSGTGKTSLTSHDHGLVAPEGIIVRQDDITALTLLDGRALGTEKNLYIKTEGLSKQNNPSLYDAARSQAALLENVVVSADGKIDFQDTSRSSNARAVVQRDEIAHTDSSIDLNRVDYIFFITRRFDILPPVVLLPSPEWATLAFMLGESVETSAGDPSKAGQAKRAVGMNPFILGSLGEEGNSFLNILRANKHIQCYLLNTGGVGGTKNITLEDSALIMRRVIEGNVKWRQDKYWGYEVPLDIPGLDMERFKSRKFYSWKKIAPLNPDLRQERMQWLEQFRNELAPEVMALLE